MPTAHLEADKKAYAPTVLMPGDPLRAKHIADNFLTDVKQVNGVRNMLGFTGVFNGSPVSVQSSGMGIPSMQIYATELIENFGAKHIVRIGSCGALQDFLNLGDVIVAAAAGTDSSTLRSRYNGYDYPAIADWGLMQLAINAASKNGYKTHVGTIFTSDFFYEPAGSEKFQLLEQYGCLAVEMEAAGLYAVAQSFGIKALTLATVSDQLKTGEKMTSDERMTSVDTMIKLALETVASI